MTVRPAPQFTLERVQTRKQATDTAAMLRRGLTSRDKWLEPYWFYDARGSELFEQICAQPEYYVTRTERSILERNAAAITEEWTTETSIFELGSGSSEKSELVLKEAVGRLHRLRYLPNDISESALNQAAVRLQESLPELEVHGIVAEFDAALDAVVERFGAPRVGMFLGGNIGNFDRSGAEDFLVRTRSRLTSSDRFLCGFDRVKDLDVLLSAYDDAAGVTAAFNLNALARINHEYGGGFDLSRFEHRVRFNEATSAIEMHLESMVDQVVAIPGLELTIQFKAGETIHTENSHKYTRERIHELAASAGFVVSRTFEDDRAYFALVELTPADGRPPP